MKKLETLNLDHNHIAQLPNLSGLTALREVSLAYNQITVFPTEFCGLKNLNMLDLSHNRITAVPDAVRTLHVLELNLNQNQVCKYCKSVFLCGYMSGACLV